MQKLKKVYFLIIIIILYLIFFDIINIIKSDYRIILMNSFYVKYMILGCIVLIGVLLIGKIDEAFVENLIKQNLVRNNREEILERHEVSRKLQIMQSYVKMDKIDELEVYIINEIDKDES